MDIHAEAKAEALQELVKAANGDRNEATLDGQIFEKHPLEFSAIPGAPLAYWAPDKCLKLFTADPNPQSLQVVSTNPLNADFRYARTWWEPAQVALGSDWLPWAKGGSYSPFYYDIHTVIAWSSSRSSYRGFLGTDNRPLERPASVQHFFRPGLTWPRRTQSGLGVRIMPANCVFADKGPAIFVPRDDFNDLFALLAITTSSAFRYLVELQMAFGSYEVGVIQRTPVPQPHASDRQALASLARLAWSLKRQIDTTSETSHAFVLPPELNERATGLDQQAIERQLRQAQQEIDDLAFVLYDIDKESRADILAWASHRTEPNDDDTNNDDELDDDGQISTDSTTAVVSWLVGVAFGRFDMRLATGERPIPPEPEPFDPLPTRSPGMWPEDEERPMPPPDILVDDPGHARDLASHVSAIASAVEVSEPDNLRRWLAREFFPLHIKMYSKSRRKAPIYWQLATPSASYSVWLYIHAFTRDTMYRVQNDYVVPKLMFEERRLETMRQELQDRSTAAERRALTNQETFVDELRGFLDEVKRVAALWNPDLDDGVLINFAPLWRLVPHHRVWQKELKTTWDALCAGKYDWAHLAMYLWPERVVPKCATDRSLAIAHDLEDVFWEQVTEGKWSARPTPTRPAKELIQERTSPAAKDALRSLLTAPTAASGGSMRRRRGTAGLANGGGR
ncbi:hypothetical protein AB0J35_34750 [Nonomuraea angiospora]|uniref:hypothetical protein n=1 Tax=Nonomuraea angiospora TaxID=46172 RepID=UPI00341277A7